MMEERRARTRRSFTDEFKRAHSAPRRTPPDGRLRSLVAVAVALPRCPWQRSGLVHGRARSAQPAAHPGMRWAAVATGTLATLAEHLLRRGWSTTSA